MDDNYSMMSLDSAQKRAVLTELLSHLLSSDNSAELPQMSEDDKLRAAYALNLCTVSVSQIIDYNDVNFLEHEYEAILNNLNLEEMPKDDALLRILKQLLDVITYFRIQEGEKKLLEKEYQQKMKNAIWNAVPNIGMIVAGGNPVTMAISLASQIGIGYMNYRKEKANIGLEQERKEWELQCSAMEQFNGLRRELFDTAWRLAEKYQFNDAYRLTERQITQFNRILMDSDDQRRYERLLYIQNHFMAYPPFWYYLGSAANTVYQNADKYGQAISEDYKAHAKDAFEKFLNCTTRNLLREDQLEASCCLELFDLLDDKAKKLQLLERAKKASGNAFDVLELCAMSYLKIGETQKAAELFRMLVNEEYNTKINAQLLSKIYVYQAVKDSSQKTREDSRKEYQLLQIRVGTENLFPMPPFSRDDYMMEEEYHEEFIDTQKKYLRMEYISMLTEFINKYAGEYDALCKSNDNNASRLIELLERMCNSVKIFAPDDAFRAYVEGAIADNRQKLQKLLINHNNGQQSEWSVSFVTLTKDAFVNLADDLYDRISDMDSMCQISENEISLERFCAENHFSRSKPNQVSALMVRENKSLANALLDQTFQKQNDLVEKRDACAAKISEINKASPLIYDSKKGSVYLYVKGSIYFDDYLRKNEVALRREGFRNFMSIVAIINDRSIWDADLILETDKITLFSKKKGKGCFTYDGIAACFSQNGLEFGGGSYSKPEVNMSVLKKMTDALANIDKDIEDSVNKDLSDMIREVYKKLR